MKDIILAALVGVLLVGNPAFADFKIGQDALDKKDYATALREFRPLAEQGNADAQFNMGLINQKGRYENPKAAKHWYTLAAKQRHVLAQRKLAVIYFREKIIRRP